MEITLDIKNGKSHIRIVDGNKIRTSNNDENIRNLLVGLPKDYSKCIIKNNNLYLYNGTLVLILKEYEKNAQTKFFNYIIKSINENTPIIDRRKIKNVNKKKIIAIALTATICLTTGFKIVRGLPTQSVDISNDIEIESNVNSLECDTLEYEEVKSMSESDNEVKNPIPKVGNEIKEEKEVNSLKVELQADYNDEKITNNEPFVSAFEVGSNLTDYTATLVDDFLASDNAYAFQEYGKDFVKDPYLLLALALGESTLNHNDTLPFGKYYNGCATGIMQIENTNINSSITAYNYQTNQNETVTITSENIQDYDTNVKIGAMMLQNCLDKYKGNIYLSIQSYNYGTSMVDWIVKMYAKKLGITPEEVMSNYDDLGWMDIVRDVHDNPKKYIPEWQYDTYGCAVYVDSILGNYAGSNIISSQNVR